MSQSGQGKQVVAAEANGDDSEANAMHGQVVDTTGAKNRAWLVKVPAVLAEKWHNADPNALLGSVEIMPPQRGQSDKPRITVVAQTTPGASSSGDQRRQRQEVYTCDSLNAQPMYVISRKRKVIDEQEGGDTDADNDDDSDVDLDEEIPPLGDDSASAAGAVIYASVDQSFNLTPKMTNAYKRDLAKRFQKAEEKKKIMMVSEESIQRGLRTAQVVKKPRADTVEAAEKRVAPVAPTRIRKAPVPRAERMERDKLHNMLLSLFARQERWRLVDLNNITKQPIDWFKKNLAEIAEYQSSGPHKGTYELKEEYKIKEDATVDQGMHDKESGVEDEWV